VVYYTIGVKNGVLILLIKENATVIARGNCGGWGSFGVLELMQVCLDENGDYYSIYRLA